MPNKNNLFHTFVGLILCLFLSVPVSYAKDNSITWYGYDGVELRALNKITAQTTTFKAKIGQTVKFGEIFVKAQTCKKPPAIEKQESASFLQVWEKPKTSAKSKWVFSGWMFASSPALSAMDHPVYDVWVLGCTGSNPEPIAIADDNDKGNGDGQSVSDLIKDLVSDKTDEDE